MTSHAKATFERLGMIARLIERIHDETFAGVVDQAEAEGRVEAFVKRLADNGIEAMPRGPVAYRAADQRVLRGDGWAFNADLLLKTVGQQPS